MFPENYSDFIHNGIRYNQIDGCGAVPSVLDIRYFGFLVFMRPSMFLSLARNDDIQFKNFTSPIGIPFLGLTLDPDNENGRVRGHEGRHRARYVMDMSNDEPMPVAFLLNGGLRSRDINELQVKSLSQGITSEDGAFVNGPLFETFLLDGQSFDIENSNNIIPKG